MSESGTAKNGSPKSIFLRCPMANQSCDKAIDGQARGRPRPERAVSAAHSAWPTSDILLLTALTLLSLLLRISWALTRNVVIENEGAEYTSIAVNLAAGRGYVGLMGGPELVQSPLYPMLIRAGLFFIHSPVGSARAVSIATGALIVPLLFMLVSVAYGRRPAWIAAVLGGLDPFLIGFSASTYADCLYTTLLAAVVYFAISSLRLPRNRRFIAWGSLLGLAYLAKPEAIGQLAVVVLLLSLVGAWKHRLKSSLSGVAIVLACYAVFASPYLAFSARYTHHLTLEGKSEMNYVMISSLNAGMDPYQAAYGLSASGQREGVLLFPQFLGRSHPHTLTELARFFLLAASRNMRLLYDGLALYVWLPLLTLALFGLFRSAWSQERALVELVLLSSFSVACIPALIAPFLSLRHVLPVMPFVVIWSAKGIDELGEWVQQTVDSLLPVGRPGVYLCSATIVLLTATILILGGRAARHEFEEATATSLYLKEAGLALAKRANGKVIVDKGTVVAFYSGASWMVMPYAPAPEILRYFELYHPDFVVIDRLDPLEDSLARALRNDPNAHPLSLNLRSPLTVYEWGGTGSAEPTGR